MSENENDIFRIIKEGNVKTLFALVKDAKQLEKINKNGHTPITYAVFLNKTRMLRLLSRRVSHINITEPKNQCTALHIAALLGCMKSVKILVKNKIDINLQNKDGETALSLAVLYGNYEIIRYLAQQNPDFSVKIPKNDTVLSRAVKQCNPYLIKLLLDPFGQKDESFFTYCSEQKIKIDLCNILMIKEKISKVKNEKGDIPLHSAAEAGRLDLLEIILNRTIESEKVKKNSLGYTAFHLAVKNGHFQAVKILCDQVSCLDEKNFFGDTPLLTAFKNNYQDILSFLLEKGAKIDETDNQASSLLHYMVQDGSIELIKNVLDKGPNVQLEDFCGATALHYAVIRGDPKILNLLLLSLKKGPDFTIFDFAAEHNYEDIFKYYLQNKVFSVQKTKFEPFRPKIFIFNKFNISEIFQTDLSYFYVKKETLDKLDKNSEENKPSFSLKSSLKTERSLKIAKFFLEKIITDCKNAKANFKERTASKTINNISPIYFSQPTEIHYKKTFN